VVGGGAKKAKKVRAVLGELKELAKGKDKDSAAGSGSGGGGASGGDTGFFSFLRLLQTEPNSGGTQQLNFHVRDEQHAPCARTHARGELLFAAQRTALPHGRAFCGCVRRIRSSMASFESGRANGSACCLPLCWSAAADLLLLRGANERASGLMNLNE
jgi:hypothetical protein